MERACPHFHGLTRGWALDFLTGWDFNLDETRQRARRLTNCFFFTGEALNLGILMNFGSSVEIDDPTDPVHSEHN